MTHSELTGRFNAMLPDLEAWARSYRVPVPDLLAHAWQHLAGATDPRRCTASTLAFYASKRCRCHRHGRDLLTHPETRGRRVDFDALHAARHAQQRDHAETVALSELWALWLETLGSRELEIICRLGHGEQVCQVATVLGISHGRVSQIRRELRLAWQAFCR